MYYNRPYFELIFITKSEHMQLHLPYHYTEEYKRKISKSSKGRHYKHSKETKLMLSKSMKGKNTWMKGRRWWTDGINNIQAEICPKGFHSGRTI